MPKMPMPELAKPILTACVVAFALDANEGLTEAITKTKAMITAGIIVVAVRFTFLIFSPLLSQNFTFTIVVLASSQTSTPVLYIVNHLHLTLAITDL